MDPNNSHPKVLKNNEIPAGAKWNTLEATNAAEKWSLLKEQACPVAKKVCRIKNLHNAAIIGCDI